MSTERPEVPTDQGKRDFLKIVLGGGVVAWLGTVIYPLVSYLRPPQQAEVEVKSVKAGPVSAIEKDSGTIVRFGSKAFSATCTHLDCTVQYRKDMGMIWCACHNGRYDLSGRNIAGPPPRPLEEYRVTVQEGEIHISSKA
jgi:Rieske Fe-S protein